MFFPTFNRWQILLGFLFFCWLSVAKAEGIADAQKGTLVTLTAEASMAVDSDEVIVDFRVQAEAKDTAGLAWRVDELSRQIARQLASEKGLQLATRNRRLQPLHHYDRDQGKSVRDGWRLLQVTRIKSQRLKAVSNWLAKIEQRGAQLDHLQYRLSQEKALAVQAQLRRQAIASFRRQADEIAVALGADSYRIIHLSTAANSSPQPMPEQRLMMAVAADSGPSLAAGKQDVTLHVSGQILLPEKVFFPGQQTADQ